MIYEWIATVTPGSIPGEISSRRATALGAGATATTNSVLVTPTPTYLDRGLLEVRRRLSGIPRPATRPRDIQERAVHETETYTTATIGDHLWAGRERRRSCRTPASSACPASRSISTAMATAAGNIRAISTNDRRQRLYRFYRTQTDVTYTVRTDTGDLPAGYLPTTAPTLLM